MKKTPEEIKDQISKKHAFEDWDHLYFELAYSKRYKDREKFFYFEKKAMQEYAEQEAKEDAIKFIEWCQKGLWRRYPCLDLSHYHPDHRDDDRYRFNGLWYNTTNIIEMDEPLTTEQLYTKYKNETK